MDYDKLLETRYRCLTLRMPVFFFSMKSYRHILSQLVRLLAQTRLSYIDFHIKMMFLATACAEIAQNSHKVYSLVLLAAMVIYMYFVGAYLEGSKKPCDSHERQGPYNIN